MMKDNKPPCFGCNERHEICHSNCDKYKAWKIDHDKKSEKIRKARIADTIADQYGKSTHIRLNKMKSGG